MQSGLDISAISEGPRPIPPQLHYLCQPRVTLALGPVYQAALMRKPVSLTRVQTTGWGGGATASLWKCGKLAGDSEHALAPFHAWKTRLQVNKNSPLPLAP